MKLKLIVIAVAECGTSFLFLYLSAQRLFNFPSI